MPEPAPASDPRAVLRAHYEVERELGDRLRAAPREVRRALYTAVYEERLERIPSHPLIQRAADPEAQRRATTRRSRMVERLLPRGGAFLEIGPGDCAVTRAMAARASVVYAVDVSEGLAAMGEELPPNVTFVLSDGTSVPVPPGSVDLAYSDQVMEHLHPEDALDQLDAVYAALRPGGTYLCITPNRLSGPWDVSRGFDDVATGLHLKEYSVEELAGVLTAAGFRVRVVATVLGRRLTPMVPASWLVPVERALARLPRGLRVRAAYLLAAVKVVGVK